MIKIKYITINECEYILIYDNEKWNNKLKCFGIEVKSGNIILIDKNFIVYNVENKDDEVINIFDIVNKQDIYKILNKMDYTVINSMDKYKDIDKDIW